MQGTAPCLNIKTKKVRRAIGPKFMHDLASAISKKHGNYKVPATNARLYSLHISTLFTSELSHISTGSTSLLSPLLYSPHLYTLSRPDSLAISTLSRPDSLASLLSPHPCSLHFSALSKSLFSHIPTFSTS